MTGNPMFTRHRTNFHPAEKFARKLSSYCTINIFALFTYNFERAGRLNSRMFKVVGKHKNFQPIRENSSGAVRMWPQKTNRI